MRVLLDEDTLKHRRWYRGQYVYAGRLTIKKVYESPQLQILLEKTHVNHPLFAAARQSPRWRLRCSRSYGSTDSCKAGATRVCP